MNKKYEGPHMIC